MSQREQELWYTTSRKWGEEHQKGNLNYERTEKIGSHPEGTEKKLFPLLYKFNLFHHPYPVRRVRLRNDDSYRFILFIQRHPVHAESKDHFLFVKNILG